MEVNLTELERVLSTAEVIYLSTSRDDRVSSRPVSPFEYRSAPICKDISSDQKGWRNAL